MTVVILDNETIGMTGGQPTLVPSSGLQQVVLGLGVDPSHLHVLEAHPRQNRSNADVLKDELGYEGLSVVILVRECIETAKTHKQERARAAGAAMVPGGVK
jgi:indolepyruvate ferredoxin oxidoreductase alpha subunit